MPFGQTLRSELWRVAFVMGALAVGGLLLNGLAAALLLGLSAYIVWHGWQLWRLYRWLRKGARVHPPESSGVWAEIFHELYRFQTRQRRRRHRLAILLTHFRESTRALPDATVVLTRRREIVWFNEAAGHLLGLRIPDDRGQRIDNLIRHPRFTHYLTKAGGRQSVEISSPVNHELMLSLQLIPYGVRSGQSLLLARNVTERHRLDQVRRDFVANVSHELRTPLTVLCGFLETIADSDADNGGRWARPLALMRQQTDRMRSTVEDLLMLARLEASAGPASRHRVGVPELLQGIQEEAEALSADRDHQIDLVIDERLDVLGIREELRAAFSNLVFNAVQYTPASGEIQIVWAAERGRPCLSVIDNGLGIEAHHVPRLTERFYRVDVGRSRERGGTGLGLAIVKHVLDRHGAQLVIDSTVGKGSTFCCEFPESARLTIEPHQDAPMAES